MRQPIRESYCHKNEILRIFPFCPFLLKCRPASCKRFASFFFTNFRPFIRLDFLPSGYDAHFACFFPLVTQRHYCNFFPPNELQKSCKNSRFRAFFFNNIISKNIKEIIGVGRCTPCPPIFYVMALWVVEFSNGGYKNQHTQRKWLNFEFWINEWQAVKKCQNLTFKVKILKITWIFLMLFFIEEYQFRSTFCVSDIFW